MSIKQLSFLLLALVLWLAPAAQAAPPRSKATNQCLSCHENKHPGIVADWFASRHAKVTTGEALRVEDPLSLKVSSKEVPEELKEVAVGCYECHSLRSEEHADTFNHAGWRIHVVVTPDDCAVCHADEAEQFSENLMSHARVNLINNPLYMDLQRTVAGTPVLREGELTFEQASEVSKNESCFYCHGSKVTVAGSTSKGPFTFPVLEGWPNQGVGRENPDGSLGSCSACHTRHQFAIEMARKPGTCEECHVGPEVRVLPVYRISKHGNIYHTLGEQWDFTPVPWTLGRDFTAPTCAVCHVSLIRDTSGNVMVKRTHRMNDRIPWRIFGLIYAHPHSQTADTSRIENRNGLHLPTTLDGAMAQEFLIDEATREERAATMRSICMGCHHQVWVDNHWRSFEQTIEETNQAVRTGTDIMQRIWEQGGAASPDHDGNMFDELVEKEWMDVWFFYANSVRFASAMGGGGDYGTFAEGRSSLNRQIMLLHRRLRQLGPEQE